MKKTKICIIAIIITTIICSCAYAIPSQAETERPEFYPKLAIVVETEKIGSCWIVYCIDKSKNIWTFYDNEGVWVKGDIVNLLMCAIKENEEEDEIIEVYWEGYTKDVNLFYQINGWR